MVVLAAYRVESNLLHEEAWVLLLVFFLMICVLNLFWYKLILKAVYRAAVGGDEDEPLIVKGEAMNSSVTGKV